MSSQIPTSNDPLAMPSLNSDASSAGDQGAGVPLTNGAISEGDGIEQEWLDRTHHVMQSFSTDPYQLSKEFAVIRAEYIKHRYGKVIHTNASKDGKVQ